MIKSVKNPMLLTTIILMDMLAGMEFDIFVPSFPALQDHFNLSAFWVEALLSVNFIGFALSLFVVGSLADRYGRKLVILGGLAVFIIGSVLCLSEISYAALLLGRFLQGIGIAAPAILSFLIIADLYPIKKQQYLMGMLNGVMNASIAAAPVIGSYITMYFKWQGNFVALLILGLIVFGMTMLFIPKHQKHEHRVPQFFEGYIAILRSKSLMLLITTFVVMFVPYWVFVGISPLLYMEDLGVSLSHFGYYQGVLALIFALGSVLVGLIVSKYDQSKMIRRSAYITVASLFIVAFVVLIDSRSPILITLALSVVVITHIIPTTILYPVCINFMPHLKGRVSAMIQGSRLVFAAISLQIAGYYYTGSFQSIGVIICIFIFFSIITLFRVLKNKELMEFSQKS